MSHAGKSYYGAKEKVGRGGRKRKERQLQEIGRDRKKSKGRK